MKKTTVAVMLLIMTASLSGCDPIGGFLDFFETLFSANMMIIRGTRTISGEGEVLTIQPGTTVRLKRSAIDESNDGALIFTNGAKLIAQGTAEEPIVFEADTGIANPKWGGFLEFEETSSTGSVVQYCHFKGDMVITLRNSTKISYCKLDNTSIDIDLTAEPVIEYNTFNGQHKINTMIGQYETTADPSPIIRYNDMQSSYYSAITFTPEAVPTIEYNNITNITKYGITWYDENNPDNTLTVTNNYIADCGGIQGVDTTGTQSKNVVYGSLSDIPIQNAGCGW